MKEAALLRYFVSQFEPRRCSEESPQVEYTKLVDEEGKARTAEKKEEIRARKDRLEKAMIAKFISTLRRMANNPDMVSSRLEFLSIDELISKL